MKTLFGIITAIATVAGIATIASKNEREAIEEQQRIALEEERLRLEAEERNRRFKQEQEYQEYQRKLANAPKKAIYKAVPMQCPLCNGHREIDDEKHQIKCPYCSHVEMLTVEGYEIDQQAFQQQLQEEQKQKAALEAEKQRIRNFNTAIGIFSVITGFLLIFFIFSPIIGSAFFIPSLIILSILLYHRFPKAGEKVWNVIKLPLICIVLFPIPITFALMKSEKMKAKLSKNVRIGLSIGTWVIYTILVVCLGVLYVKSFHNALHPTDYYQYSANELREEVTTEPPTQETTTLPVETVIPAANKTNLEFYDASTNFEVEMGGLIISIPKCWHESGNQEGDTYRQYWDSEEKINIGQLGLTVFDIKTDITDNQKFTNDCIECASGIMSGIYKDTTDDLPIQDIIINDFKGISTYKTGMVKLNSKELQIDSYISMVYNSSDNQLVVINLMEMNESTQTYWNDYNKIVSTIRRANIEEISTENQTVENIEVTSESVDTTNISETKVNIYPQEKAFRAAVVSLTNALSSDVFTSDGSQHDTAKYHSYSDTSAFYMSILSKGTWTEKSSDTWHVDNLILQPDGYDVLINVPINVSTEANASLDVTFDGTNYIISNISGMYAIPGKEEIGTDLSYLNSDNMSKTALTVSKNMIENDR
ncbi:hypothetical protein [uncultured Ruminococcus sp.]|uniref:hypothetical protein n=1 Tax=uncultured Ruminococcus sp. TaxID=165186 RepID=UPI0025F74B56|nr:hypothetical protein [uncultured Ruminococcus sp.]